MDAILAKRNLARERDDAQQAVDDKIQRIAASGKETEFSVPQMPIGGDINFSKLRPLNIISIITKEVGWITDVTGIPDGVKNIKFEKQLLVDSPQLPKSVETLNLNGNYIETLNFSHLTRLKIARLNNNQIREISKRNLPESLEELYIDNNAVSSINLDYFPKLRVLHCRNNNMIRLENIPASLVDLQIEDGNPHVILDYAFLPKSLGSEDDETQKGTEHEFVESIHDYFTLKEKYENNEKNARRDARYNAVIVRKKGEKYGRRVARELLPKCVNCKRPVGTVFKTREDRLLAYCGDAGSPCPLKIEIYKGNFESDDKSAADVSMLLQETKEKIIRQKMDVLFNYATEEETVAKFKGLIEDYNLYSVLHKADLDMREDKQFNVHKREIIKSKKLKIEDIKAAMNSHMDEYAESGNRDELITAMDIYVREYIPEINNLRLLKYGVMEMNVPGTMDPRDTDVRVLNQCAASLRQLETLHGEIPKVIKFVKGPVANEKEKSGKDTSSQPEENMEDNGEDGDGGGDGYENGEEVISFMSEKN